MYMHVYIFLYVSCEFKRIWARLHSNYHLSSNNHLVQSNKRERKRGGVSGCHSSVAEHWQLKPEALGSIPGSTTLPFQWSSDSNSPDYLSLDDLYQSLDLREAQSIGLSMLWYRSDSLKFTFLRTYVYAFVYLHVCIHVYTYVKAHILYKLVAY